MTRPPRDSRAQRIVAAALLAIGLAATARLTPQRITPAPATLVDINSAGVHDLQLLPGIGPAFAERIVEDRASNGPFANVDDLARVKGVGERTVLRLRAFATVGD